MAQPSIASSSIGEVFTGARVGRAFPEPCLGLSTPRLPEDKP